MLQHQRGLKGLQGVPRERSEREKLLLTGGSEMSPEEMMMLIQQMGGAGAAPGPGPTQDPRIMELSRMMGQPGMPGQGGPSMRGMTTENYLDPQMGPSDEDLHEEDQMIENHQLQEMEDEEQSRSSTEDELDMVNRNINGIDNRVTDKGDDRDQGAPLSGDIDADRAELLRLKNSGDHLSYEGFLQEFAEMYGEEEIPTDDNDEDLP